MNIFKKKAFEKIKIYSKEAESLNLFNMMHEKLYGEKYLISWVCISINFRISRINTKKKLLKWLFNIN